MIEEYFLKKFLPTFPLTNRTIYRVATITNKLKSLKVAQSKDDNYGCKDDDIYGVVDGCDVVCDVMCDVVCGVMCDVICGCMYGVEGLGKVK